MIYTDLSLKVEAKHPISGDIGRLFDSTAINTAIKNLLFTKKGTIPFNRFKGTNLWKLVGEMNTAIVRHQAKTEVQECLINFEPRINVIQVDVYQGAVDTDENSLFIKIVYSIKSTNSLGELDVKIDLNR